MNSCKETNKELDKKVNESEQWLLNGDCSLCRKYEYCFKMCSARKNYIENYTMNKIQSMIMNKFFGGKR